MSDWGVFIGYWPGWLSLTIATLLAVNKAIEESQKFATFFGVVGRKIHNHALRREGFNTASVEVAKAVSDAVEAARAKWLSDENAAIKTLDARLETVTTVTAAQRQDIDDLRIQIRCMTSYTEYEDMWHSRLRAAVIRSDDGTIHISDMPDHIGYYDFEMKYRANPGWRDWI